MARFERVRGDARDEAETTQARRSRLRSPESRGAGQGTRHSTAVHFVSFHVRSVSKAADERESQFNPQSSSHLSAKHDLRNADQVRELLPDCNNGQSGIQGRAEDDREGYASTYAAMER